MNISLAQRAAATVTVAGVTYPLDDYPAAYVDHLDWTICDLKEVLRRIEAERLTPDTAPDSVTQITDVSTLLLRGQVTFPVRVGITTDLEVYSYHDGRVEVAGDSRHPASLAVDWCRANVSAPWIVELEGETDGLASIIIWFDRVEDRDALQAHLTAGAGDAA